MLPNFGKKKSKIRAAHSSFESRLLISVLLTGLPAALFCLLLLWSTHYTLDHKIEGTVLLLLIWISLVISKSQSLIHSLRVLANVVAAVKEEDFSFRASLAFRGDALGELAIEINDLAQALETERLKTIDSLNLLRKVMDKAGAVILAFSADDRLCLINRAGADLLGFPEEHVLNCTATELGLRDLMDGPSSQTLSFPFGNIEKRWIVRRSSFRQHGVPHRLVVLSEASEALRAEERSAWQRIIRVMGHEINNSLAPISSIARTECRMLTQLALPPKELENLRHGLEIISDRAESLNRFLQSYARLAKLPPPRLSFVSVQELIEHAAAVESRLHIALSRGPDVILHVDPDQLLQALINLLANAVEAVFQRSEPPHEADPIAISWHNGTAGLEITIRDRGIGLADTSNLFVPFYTTKAKGTGIGLVLSRHIIEAHGGTLTIKNLEGALGCEVKIQLPRRVQTAGLMSPQSVPGKQIK
jgi:two-component system nitrogen regulation sensor histidine kinase NtrY